MVGGGSLCKEGKKERTKLWSTTRDQKGHSIQLLMGRWRKSPTLGHGKASGTAYNQFSKEIQCLSSVLGLH